LHRESWHLLFQIIVVIVVTSACVFSGPLATVSSRTSRTIQESTLGVLQTVKTPGSSQNLLDAMVLWNNTIQSLDQASFPDSQLLDYLPPSTVNWTYVASEWNPTWTMECNYTSETVLHNVTGAGNSTFYDPINAFPVYRDTYDPSWLDTSKYRVQANFDSWTAGSGENAPFTDVFFYIMIESDPAINDRWGPNNETMELSMSVLHAQNFSALDNEWFNEADATTWRPTGPVGNASYTRFECTITRKPEVLDEDLIPWVWTNDTYSITLAYVTYFDYPFEQEEFVSITYSTPAPEDILRFYQAYMVTVGTIFDVSPTPKEISVWMDTVQVSIVFLAIIIISTALILWLSGRYFFFIRRHKSDLGKAFVPDGKIEWMLHAARVAADAVEEEHMNEGEKAKDRDYFQAATFGCSSSDVNNSDGEIRRPSLARVHTRGNSMSGASPSTRDSVSKSTSNRPLPPLVIHEGKESENGLEKPPNSVDSKVGFELTVFSAGKSSQSASRDHSPHSDGNMLNPQVSRKSSISGSRPSHSCETASPNASSCRSIIPEAREVSSTNGTADCLDKKP
jgi:hypothetical protein